MSDDIFMRFMAERGISFPTVSLVEKWLLREMIEDGQATPKIKTFLQDFAKRRDLDLTRS